MAEIAKQIAVTGNGDTLITWADVTENDTFEQYALLEAVSEISVHITGTFGGATVTIGGGNVSSEMLTMTQIGGAADAVVTAADIFSLLDRPLFLQPSAAGGTSSSITIYMMVRK